MNLTDQVTSYIEQHSLLPPDDLILVGISGGVDSVVLLHVLHRLGVTLSAVHVNYQLRGEDADADEALVRSYCKELGVPLHVERFETKAIAESRGLSVQETARELRYELFARLARQEDITAVAVGHHLDDQAETILLNLFRGAGPEGMAGMAARRELVPGSGAYVIRPLLNVRRPELEAYALEEGLTWREDTTNTNPDYTRSAIRTMILPAIEAHFGMAVRDNIARAGDLMRDYVDEVIRPGAEEGWEVCARPNGDAGGMLDLTCLAGYPSVMRRRIILEALKRWVPNAPYSHATAGEIERLIEAQTGRRVNIGHGSVMRDREGLVFSNATSEPENAAPELELRLGDGITAPGGTLYTEVLAEAPASLDPGTPLVGYVDADRITEPLVLRSWRPGDRFVPLGMEHEKKVSDYLTDTKVPSAERHQVAVLCSGGRIVWLVGHRIDAGVRVTTETRRIAKITFVPA